MGLLEIRNLTFRYRGQDNPSLRDICLKIERGEWVLLTGGLGSGKTTLLRCIVGLAPQYFKGEFKGKVIVNGKSLGESRVREISKIVGVMFENPDRQLLGLTVEEDVAYSMAYDDPERVDEILKMMGILDLKNRNTRDLSLGQKVKVLISSILASNPMLILLDEPLSYLDPESRLDVLDALYMVKKGRGLSVLITDSGLNFEVLHGMVDRVLFMENGVISHSVRGGGFARKYQVQKWDRKRSVEDAAIIEAYNLGFKYPNGVLAVRNTSITLKRGYVYGLLGPNGSGKTTLALILAGVLKPNFGRSVLRFKGKDYRRIKPYEMCRKVNYVFPDPEIQLFRDSPFDELFFTASLDDYSSDMKRKIYSLINMFDLKKFMEKRVELLNRGEKLMTVAVSTLLLDPEVIIFDEPFGGLDWKWTSKILDLIFYLRNRGKTVLVITHNQMLADELFDFNFRMRDGTISGGNFAL